MSSSSSELSVLVGSSSSSQAAMEASEQPPKLEDFLGGGHSFSHHDHNMFNAATTTATASSIGLSMIKTWLRNQPAPGPAQAPPSASSQMDCGSLGEAGPAVPAASSQSLSLSMSTGAAAAVSGGGESSYSPESNNHKQKDHVGEAMARKSIDTFGQRTSIYRGVTRFIEMNIEILHSFHVSF